MSLGLFIIEKDTQQKKKKHNEAYGKNDGNAHYL
tara:strand:+ start:1080 stop:1181 length:102 start_codon:yes stop_codon:yes gene_type:complete